MVLLRLGFNLRLMLKITIVVDTGHIVAFTEGLDYNISAIGSYKSFFFKDFIVEGSAKYYLKSGSNNGKVISSTFLSNLMPVLRVLI